MNKMCECDSCYILTMIYDKVIGDIDLCCEFLWE